MSTLYFDEMTSEFKLSSTEASGKDLKVIATIPDIDPANPDYEAQTTLYRAAIGHAVAVAKAKVTETGPRIRLYKAIMSTFDFDALDSGLYMGYQIDVQAGQNAITGRNELSFA